MVCKALTNLCHIFIAVNLQPGGRTQFVKVQVDELVFNTACQYLFPKPAAKPVNNTPVAPRPAAPKPMPKPEPKVEKVEKKEPIALNNDQNKVMDISLNDDDDLR